jgi:hypothetical protein
MQTNVKIKITDSGDAWIYEHMPYLMAFSELLQKWIISILPAAAAFFEYMDNRPGLDSIIPAAARRQIEKKEIEKIKDFFVILRKNIETAKAILISIDGYIAINTAAEQAYDSVAPPCAPPDTSASSSAPFFNINIQKINDKEQRQFYIDQLYNLIDILYLPNYIPIIDDKINDDVLSGDIRRKIISDLVGHAVKNPHFYPAIFNKWNEKTEKKTQNFINFKIRQFWRDITTRDTHDESRTAPAMLHARQSYFAAHGGIASLDAVIPSMDGDNATLYDYIADRSAVGISPEADLLIWEYINSRPDHDDVDDESAQTLFTSEDEDEPDDAQLIIVDVKPPRPRTGRAKRLQSQQAFDFGGGYDEN